MHLSGWHYIIKYAHTNIMWKDKVRNEATRETTGQDMMETTIKKRRLRWFSYMRCMDDSRRTK